MKSPKNKAASRLKSLKEEEISSSEDENLLDEEISFGGKEELSGISNDHSEMEDDFGASILKFAEHSGKTQFTSTSTQNYTEREEDHSKVDHSDEGTAVLTENHQIDKTDVATSDINESTYREITNGRSGITNESERVSYGDVYENDTMAPMQGQSVDGILKQSEHLRIAQDKINDLESELDELRRQNHELSNDAESIASLNETYSGQIENLKMELTHIRLTLSEEVKILRHSMHEKERLLNETKQSNSDLKSKVESNFKSIRKRERDLEYRLELAKVDEAALLKSKDKMILDLRREVEKKEQERTAFERKNKEHFQKIQEQQQTVRTVVRALRIALTRLEGDFGVDFEVLKKAE